MREALGKISFQQLEIFFCVVELESFTKAALQLHLTQSAVSKSIARLEQELNLQLFTRHYRELHVTQAGRELSRHWKEQTEQIYAAYEEIYHLQHAKDNELRVGITNTTDFDTYYWPIMNRFLARYPECVILPESNNMEQLIAALYDGQLDLIFVPDFMHYRLDDLGLLWKWAARDSVQILMPADHPLADRELTLERIKDERILVLDEGAYPENIRFVKELFASEGYCVTPAKKVLRTPDGIRDFYSPSDGIMLSDSFFKYDYDRRNIIRRPLKGYQNGIICSWNEENLSRYLQNLLKEIPLREQV